MILLRLPFNRDYIFTLHIFTGIQEYKEFFMDSGIQRVFHGFRNTRSLSMIQKFMEFFMDLRIQRVFHGFWNTKSFSWI